MRPSRLATRRTFKVMPYMNSPAIPPTPSMLRNSATEGSRWLGMTPDRIRRWLRECTPHDHAGGAHRPPAVRHEETSGLASFLHIVDLRYAHAVITAGLTRSMVCTVLVQARLLTGECHPFPGYPFYSSKSEVFARLATSSDVRSFVGLVHTHRLSNAPYSTRWRCSAIAARSQRSPMHGGPLARTHQ